MNGFLIFFPHFFFLCSCAALLPSSALNRLSKRRDKWSFLLIILHYPVWGCILRTDPAQWDLRSFFTLDFAHPHHLPNQRVEWTVTLTFGTSPRRSRNFGVAFLFLLLSTQHWTQLSKELLTSPVCTQWGCSSECTAPPLGSFCFPAASRVSDSGMK